MSPGKFNPVMRPGDGAKVSGFSALMRHSMACPRRRHGARYDLAQAVTGGDQDLALHQIDARDRFRHRMLHLDARVHLDEIKIAILVHQELDGARVGVADVAHGFAQARPSSSRAALD